MPMPRSKESLVSLSNTFHCTPPPPTRPRASRAGGSTAEQPALNRVEAALELLIARGVLASRMLPDGKLIYACATASRVPAAND